MEQDTAQPTASPKIWLDKVEARILGSLIEKAALTPESYPLTANAVVIACNQKTSRDPLMNLEPGAVGHSLRQLEDKGLVRVVHGARALRYEHCVDGAWTVTPRQRALLCLLMLRGPQTVPELLARSERLAAFANGEEVRETLERLNQRDPPMATCLGRLSGQREDRYAHLLCGPVATETGRPAPTADERPALGTPARLAQLEQMVAELQQEVADLKQRLQDPLTAAPSQPMPGAAHGC